MSTITLIRGLPGSGKSTLAKSLGVFHVEADMYFINNGVYTYNPEKIKYAHLWCFDTVKIAMQNNVEIVVSNTFTQRWELALYTALANKNDYKVEILECKGNYKNTHQVPAEVIKAMKKRWENVDNLVGW